MRSAGKPIVRRKGIRRRAGGHAAAPGRGGETFESRHPKAEKYSVRKGEVTMTHGMESFFDWLLRTSWQAAVLALLVLAVQWIFQKRLSASWRHALWLLVLVRLLLPVSP